jgi:DNA-binding response OmpR family regulator
MLDFGPSSVDGWLARLVGNELGLSADELLDSEARQLVIDGGRVSLTRLEFGVMDYLIRREGKAVDRQSLLADVWGYDYQGGSNVVDAVVRVLRKKLGPYASVIETISGVGYRYNGR